MSVEYIDFPTEEYSSPIEPQSPPERICTIELVEFDPERENPKISLTHTETEFKVVVILLPDDSSVLLYMSDPPDQKHRAYRRLKITKNYFRSEDQAFQDDPLELAQDLCLNWLGLNFIMEDLSTQRAFFADDTTRALVFGEPETTLVEEEDALVRLTALHRIESSSVSIPANSIF